MQCVRQMCWRVTPPLIWNSVCSLAIVVTISERNYWRRGVETISKIKNCRSFWDVSNQAVAPGGSPKKGYGRKKVKGPLFDSEGAEKFCQEESIAFFSWGPNSEGDQGPLAPMVQAPLESGTRRPHNDGDRIISTLMYTVLIGWEHHVTSPLIDTTITTWLSQLIRYRHYCEFWRDRTLLHQVRFACTQKALTGKNVLHILNHYMRQWVNGIFSIEPHE